MSHLISESKWNDENEVQATLRYIDVTGVVNTDLMESDQRQRSDRANGRGSSPNTDKRPVSRYTILPLRSVQLAVIFVHVWNSE